MIASLLLLTTLIQPPTAPPTSGAERAQWIDATPILRQHHPKTNKLPFLDSQTARLSIRRTKTRKAEEQLGDIRNFWVVDLTRYTATGEMIMNEDKTQLPAELVGKTPSAYLYLEVGLYVDGATLDNLVDEFQNNIRPKVEAVYGAPPDALDNDPHVTILVTTLPGASLAGATVAGYFDDANQHTDAEAMYRELGHSNEREMITINQAFVTNSMYLSMALGIFAHEYQHLIHFARDPNEAVWFNEANSEFAMIVAGYDDSTVDHATMFGFNPTLSLVAPDGFLEQEQYGAVLYFMRYIDAHYGGYEGVGKAARNPLANVEGVDDFLRANHATTFRQVYRDWTLANILDETGGPYTYPFDETPSYYRQLWEMLGIQTFFTARFDSLADEQFETYLEQWASDYYLFHRGGSSSDADFHGFVTVDKPAHFEASYVGLHEITYLLAPQYKILHETPVQFDANGHGEFQIKKEDTCFALIVRHVSASVEETNCSTATYTMGVRSGVAPNLINDLTAPATPQLETEKIDGDRVFLEWIAPGDDGLTGWASYYELRYSTSTLTSATFSQGTRVGALAHPKIGGTSETLVCADLPEETPLTFLLRATDDMGNASWSDVVHATTGVRDRIAPGRVTSLRAELKTNTEARFGWIAPGDDAQEGQATHYDIRWSYEPITDLWSFRHANIVEPPETPAPAGTAESSSIFDIEWENLYVAMRTFDELGNVSEISEVLRFSHVPGEPEILADPEPLSVDPGDPAQFSVTTSGTAPLAYQWRKNGVDITQGDPNSAIFALDAAQETDEGAYSCVVTNDKGVAVSREATLTVNDPPHITSHPESLTIRFDDKAIFTVSATGSEPFTYQWKKDGAPIQNAPNSASLTVSRVRSSDAGAYTCLVTNSAGQAESNAATLTVVRSQAGWQVY